MKFLKIYFFTLVTFQLTLSSCEDVGKVEPYEGGIPIVVTSCPDAIANSSVALSDFALADLTDPNYADLCNNYRDALEEEKISCGDPDGKIEALIVGLFKCEDFTRLTCPVLSLNTLNAFNNFSTKLPTDPDYANSCSVYKQALEDQKAVCGDPDGSLVIKIDALLDCVISPSPDCDTANARIILTEPLFNITPIDDPNYAYVCNRYNLILQDQLAICSDTADIQAVIDSLDGCSVSREATATSACKTCVLSEITQEVCEGTNGNAFVSGMDTNVEYNQYITLQETTATCN